MFGCETALFSDCFQTPVTQANLAVNHQTGKEGKMKAFFSYSNSCDVVLTAYLHRFHDNPSTAIAHFWSSSSSWTGIYHDVGKW